MDFLSYSLGLFYSLLCILHSISNKGSHHLEPQLLLRTKSGPRMLALILDLSLVLF